MFQLGGPETLEDIEPFLFNLFCDPDIIDFPFARLGRKPLAKLISSTRASKVRRHYAEIGGGSPIRRNTEAQAHALECELRSHGLDARCVVAMRYWRPFTREAVAELEAAGCGEIVLLPLYPQYSSTTTGSSLNEWERRARDEWRVGTGERPSLATGNRQLATLISDFYRHEGYLDSVVERIEAALERFPEPRSAELVFSAHGVPLRVIERGDPYQQQVEETVALVMARGAFSNPHRICYQSKVGASRWLEPTLRATLRDLAASGLKDVCVVPISFVSDHVETLGEIDREARALAGSLGIRQFEMTAGLNDSPRFIAALADLVMQAVAPASSPAVSRPSSAADVLADSSAQALIAAD